jgi:hypothetical protein
VRFAFSNHFQLIASDGYSVPMPHGSFWPEREVRTGSENVWSSGWTGSGSTTTKTTRLTQSRHPHDIWLALTAQKLSAPK